MSKDTTIDSRAGEIEIALKRLEQGVISLKQADDDFHAMIVDTEIHRSQVQCYVPTHEEHELLKKPGPFDTDLRMTSNWNKTEDTPSTQDTESKWLNFCSFKHKMY